MMQLFFFVLLNEFSIDHFEAEFKEKLSYGMYESRHKSTYKPYKMER
jgi:hypothetical protein